MNVSWVPSSSHFSCSTCRDKAPAQSFLCLSSFMTSVHVTRTMQEWQNKTNKPKGTVSGVLLLLWYAEGDVIWVFRASVQLISEFHRKELTCIHSLHYWVLQDQAVCISGGNNRIRGGKDPFSLPMQTSQWELLDASNSSNPVWNTKVLLSVFLLLQTHPRSNVELFKKVSSAAVQLSVMWGGVTKQKVCRGCTTPNALDRQSLWYLILSFQQQNKWELTVDTSIYFHSWLVCMYSGPWQRESILNIKYSRMQTHLLSGCRTCGTEWRKEL